jgi:hypothetical protein
MGETEGRRSLGLPQGRVIVAGSREGIRENDVWDFLDSYFFSAIRADWDGGRERWYCSKLGEIVSGCAKGVDTVGERWAEGRNQKLTRFPANWDKYRKAAGIIRNEEMAAYADGLIAFWDGESRGTKHMIDTMRKLKKPVVVVYA